MLKNVFVFLTLFTICSCHFKNQKQINTSNPITDTAILDTVFKFLDLSKSQIITKLNFNNYQVKVEKNNIDPMLGLGHYTVDTLLEISIEANGFCATFSCFKNKCNRIFVFPIQYDLYEKLFNNYHSFYYLDIDQFLSKDNKSRFDIIKSESDSKKTPYFVFTSNK